MSRGGRRPGAGRPKDAFLEFQRARRDAVARVVTATRWRAAILGMLEKIEEGDALAFRALAPYVMGAPPKEITVKVDVESRIRAMASDLGLDPDEAVREAMAHLEATRVG